MSTPITFSVVIPCYNRAHSVLPTLESVRKQTYPHFECLIVDDGSKDGAELEKLVESLNDNRFVYIRQENGGASNARNTGIMRATGAYVAFLDSDDFYLEDKLETDDALIRKYRDPAIVIFSQVLVDRGVGNYATSPERAPLAGERISDYLIRHRGFTQTSTLVVERFLAQKTLFQEGLPMAQDYDFPIRLEANGAKFVMKDEPKVIWIDIDNPNRVSNMPAYEPMIDWIENLRPTIGDRAYYAFRGTHIARLAAPRDRLFAISLFLQAAVRFALPPKLFSKAFLQVVFPRSYYRRAYDLYLGCKNRLRFSA